MYDVRIPPQATFGTSPYTPLLAKRLRPNQICHTGFTGENAVLLLPDDFEIEWRSSHMSRSHKIRGISDRDKEGGVEPQLEECSADSREGFEAVTNGSASVAFSWR